MERLERSGNATVSLTGWSLRPMLYCSAMQFMFFGCCSLQASDQPAPKPPFSAIEPQRETYTRGAFFSF